MGIISSEHPSCWAMGIARATVTERAAMARERSGGSESARPATTVADMDTIDATAAHPMTSAAWRACARWGGMRGSGQSSAGGSVAEEPRRSAVHEVV